MFNASATWPTTVYEHFASTVVILQNWLRKNSCPLKLTTLERSGRLANWALENSEAHTLALVGGWALKNKSAHFFSAIWTVTIQGKSWPLTWWSLTWWSVVTPNHLALRLYNILNFYAGEAGPAVALHPNSGPACWVCTVNIVSSLIKLDEETKIKFYLGQYAKL